MNKKNKTILLIMALSWYIIGASWLGAWIYNTYVTEAYKVAFWVSVTANALSLYAAVMYHVIEGGEE